MRSFIPIILFFFFLTQTVFAGDVELFTSEANNVEDARGLIKPIEKAVISSQISAKIEKIQYKDSDAFNKGDVLIRFDCSFYRAELLSAEASLNAKKKIYENDKKLLDLNAISDIDVSLSESEMDIARAERLLRLIRVNQCEIKAPYSGRVIEVKVNEHENVTADTEMLSILNDKAIEIQLIVPSTWLNWLKKEVSFRFTIDETGETLKAFVKKIGAIVDPVSQTVKIIGAFETQPDNVLSGMSGTAQF